ncbi:MAG: tRNA pseudouridine32 synthase/23S rRNA pseudouridine746 synthase [Glaciecola sp.]|uniref:RluA family pseudouridine synthase n=1 Tax=Congregibacter sp. TaxID=2744308 RepID=UPI0039E6DFEC
MTASSDTQEPLELPPYLVPHSPEPVRLIYADDHLLLIHKPDLLLSVPGRHPLNYDCMITRLQERFPDALVVHRLDLDTSGLMMVARGKASQGALSRLFQERAVEKHYRAWVSGTVSADEGKVEFSIARDWENRPLQKICEETGKKSLTYFKVLAREEGNSLLELQPATGRTHQLRIHCREMGHPILGCDMYAPPAILGSAPRLMLHATRIAFAHPFTGRKIVGHCPAPF